MNAILVMSAVAFFHATLISSVPAANSRLAVSPPNVHLVFSEPLEAQLAHVSLISADGATTVLRVGGDPHDVHAIVAPLDSLAEGAYRIAWRVVSADGHPVEGSVVFSVGRVASAIDTVPAPPPTSSEEEEAATWGPAIAGAPVLPALLRGAGVGSLMAAAGLLFFLAWARLGPAARPGRIALWLAAASAILLVAHLAAWLVNASPDHRLDAEWIAAASGTTVGRIEMWRTGLAVLALWALGLARRPRLALLLAMAALTVSGATGHAAAIQPRWAIPAKALHLVAAALWLGGLLWLVVHERHRDGESERDWSARALVEAGRVSSVALVAVIVVTLSGVAQTLLFTPSIAGLLSSAYGIVVLAKVVGLVVLAGFGAHHRVRVIPRLAASSFATDGVRFDVVRRDFARTVSNEIVVLWIVVLLGGFLAYLPPAAEEGPHVASPTTSPHDHA